MFLSKSRELNIALRKQWKSLPTFLVRTLSGFMQKAIRLKILLECGLGGKALYTATYDLVSCGPKNRFRTSNGLILHNCLGLGYGMGPKKLVKTAKESGEIITLSNARGFYRSYWDTFPNVRRLSDRLAAKVAAESRLINQFGYRLVPEPHKAFNALIQSSVSGIVEILGTKVEAVAPYSEFLGLIHDELLYEVPIPRVEEFRGHMAQATDSLNDDLKWSVRIRTGFVASDKSWYEAK